MKKRIISFAIVLVMIVAMIPAVLVSTSAIYYYDGYDAAVVTEGAIEIDGDLTPDAAYLAGEKITNLSTRTYNDRDGKGETSAFEAYVAADDNGVYFWISVTDQSLDKADFITTEEVLNEETGEYETVTRVPLANMGDRVEFTLRADGPDQNARVAGNVGFDYLGTLTNNAKYGTLDKTLMNYATTTNENGWVGEIYVPWAALGTGFAGMTRDDITSFQMGLQVNNAYNGKVTDEDGKTHNANDHKAYSYDFNNAGSMYRGMFGGHEYSQSGDRYSGWQGSHLIPVNFVGIEVAVVADALEIDGVLDAAYAKSEGVLEAWYTKPDAKADFDADVYFVATVDGLYVYADILDSTLNKDDSTAVGTGDKFQLYFQMGTHNSTHNWGYVEVDYTATNNFAYTDKASGWYCESPNAANMTHYIGTTETGWVTEFFLPWVGDIKMDGLNDLSKQAVSVATQVNDAGTGGAIYSNRFGERSWYSHDGNYGPSGHFWFAPLVFKFDADVTPTVKTYAQYVDSITLDGVKDAKYSDLAVDFVDVAHVIEDRYMGKSYGWHYGDIVAAKIYYAFTDTDVYVFVEVYDNTVPKSNYENEYVSIYSTNGESAGKFNLRANGTFGNASNYEGTSRGYELLKEDKSNAATANLALTYVGEKTAYTGYNVEFKMALSASDKAALAAGKPISVGIGVETNDAAWLPEKLADKTADGRLYYAYNEKSGGSWWVSSNFTKGYMAMPEVRLDKDYDFAAEITGANVALGESISVNYYAQLGTGDPQYYAMQFDFNGTTTTVKPVKTANPGEYMFTFEGIAPQCMGDNLAATLLYAGVAVDTVAEYSVFQNCMNIVNADPTNAALVQLVADLGAYGAAAQVYANYKTDALVNAGFEDYATVVESIDNSDRAITGSVDGAAITAAGVYFDNTNRVYVKVTITDETVVENLSLTINGAAATPETTKVDNVVIFYTEELAATEFDEVFTFVLSNGTDAQTVTYSVNAYCKAKLDAANPATAALAAATYAYGASAEAYVA